MAGNNTRCKRQVNYAMLNRKGFSASKVKRPVRTTQSKPKKKKASSVPSSPQASPELNNDSRAGAKHGNYSTVNQAALSAVMSRLSENEREFQTDPTQQNNAIVVLNGNSAKQGVNAGSHDQGGDKLSPPADGVNAINTENSYNSHKNSDVVVVNTSSRNSMDPKAKLREEIAQLEALLQDEEDEET